MARVYIDAGHGGYDNGAVSEGRREKDDNLALALAVGEILSDNGVEVSYTRTEDVYDSPVRKAQIANEGDADLLVSIHRNSSEQPEMYSGVQTLIFDSGGLKEDVANAINEELEAVGFNNLGVDLRRNLAILRRSEMDAVLVEAGFINTQYDNNLFDSEFYNIAYGIANGIYKSLFGTSLPGNNQGVIVPPSENNGNSNGRPGNNGTAGGRPGAMPPGRPGTLPPGMRPGYIVQTGLFSNYDNAKKQFDSLAAMRLPARIDAYKQYHRVSVGHDLSYGEAADIERRLRARGYDTLIVRVR